MKNNSPKQHTGPLRKEMKSARKGVNIILDDQLRWDATVYAAKQKKKLPELVEELLRKALGSPHATGKI